MGLKILGMGFSDYLRDKMNLFDCGIVILSLIELLIFGNIFKNLFFLSKILDLKFKLNIFLSKSKSYYKFNNK